MLKNDRGWIILEDLIYPMLEYLMCLFVVPWMCGCSGRYSEQVITIQTQTRQLTRCWIYQPRAMWGSPMWIPESSLCPLGGNAGCGMGSLLLRACRAPGCCRGISNSNFMRPRIRESTAFSSNVGLGSEAGGSAPKRCIDAPHAVVHSCNFSRQVLGWFLTSLTINSTIAVFSTCYLYFKNLPHSKL